MKKSPYMSRSELIEYLKVDVFAAEARELAKNTEVKTWRQKLNTVATYCESIANERCLCLDSCELPTVTRRRKHCEMRLMSSDECRMRDLKNAHKNEKVTINNEDLIILFQVVDHCCCSRCKEGDVVKKCEVRIILHHLGYPAYDDNPKDGECEFHWDSKANELGLDIDYKEAN